MLQSQFVQSVFDRGKYGEINSKKNQVTLSCFPCFLAKYLSLHTAADVSA